MVSNAHEEEVTLTVRKAAYITHFLKKMKGQTLNNIAIFPGGNLDGGNHFFKNL